MEWPFEIVDGRGRRDYGQQDRNSSMIGMYCRGMTLEEVGTVFGVTRERVRQILKKKGIQADQGGASLRALSKVEEHKQAQLERIGRREAKFRKRFGCSRAEAESIMGGPFVLYKSRNPIGAYISQMENAKGQGKGWNITFPDWWRIWEESGKWGQRGRGKGYCMARYGDSGPYEVGNVYICTIGQNFSDSYLVKTAKERTFKRGPGKKGYVKKKKWYYVYCGDDSKIVSKHATAEEARAAYLKTWHERYDPVDTPS